MKKLILLTFYSLIAVTLLAQQNYQAAYIVNLEKDTINGFIDYQNWNNNPEQIRFKADLKMDAKVYTPNDINSFMVYEEKYISAEVEAEMSARSTDNLTYDTELILEKRRVFLSSLVEGNISLAYYKDPLGYENFYVFNEQEFQLLIYKRYFADVDKRKVVKENKKYMGQLMVYLMDCEEVKNQISKTPYSRKSLESLFKNYYEKCEGNGAIYIQKREKDKIKFGLLAGVALSQPKFYSDVDYLSIPKYPSSTNFSAAAFLEVYFSRSKGNWSINNELGFSNYTSTATHVISTRTTKVNIAETNIQLNNMFRYYFQINKVDLFANIGIANLFLVSSTDEAVLTSPNFNNSIQYKEAIGYMQAWKLGASAGAGLRWNDISIEYRYQTSNAMSIFRKPKYWYTSSFVFLGYRF